MQGKLRAEPWSGVCAHNGTKTFRQSPEEGFRRASGTRRIAAVATLKHRAIVRRASGAFLRRACLGYQICFFVTAASIWP
jgi:hypothetical protein